MPRPSASVPYRIISGGGFGLKKYPQETKQISKVECMSSVCLEISICIGLLNDNIKIQQLLFLKAVSFKFFSDSHESEPTFQNKGDFCLIGQFFLRLSVIHFTSGSGMLGKADEDFKKQQGQLA